MYFIVEKFLKNFQTYYQNIFNCKRAFYVENLWCLKLKLKRTSLPLSPALQVIASAKRIVARTSRSFVILVLIWGSWNQDQIVLVWSSYKKKCKKHCLGNIFLELQQIQWQLSLIYLGRNQQSFIKRSKKFKTNSSICRYSQKIMYFYKYYIDQV